MTGGCAAEEVLLDIADRVARPAASMVSARARLALLAGRLPAPAGPAAAGVAAAQRAGMAVDVVGNGDRVWLAHHDDGCTLVVDPGAPVGPFEGGLLGVDLHWRCAHELAALTLGVVAARAERAGDLDLALRVVRARMTLPGEHGEVAALRARMN